MNELNNISILPFYGSPDFQNAKNWWIYGAIYPLFTPSIPSFQIRRPARLMPIGLEIVKRGGEEPPLALADINADGTIHSSPDEQTAVLELDAEQLALLDNPSTLYLSGIPTARSEDYYMISYTVPGPSSDPDPVNITQNLSPLSTDGTFTGEWGIGLGNALSLRVQIFNNAVSPKEGIVSLNDEPAPVTVEMYREDGTRVYPTYLEDAISIKRVGDYDYITFDDSVPVGVSGIGVGRFFLKIYDYAQVWYSDVFTLTAPISPFLKIQWWDDDDFVLDDGDRIIYRDAEGTQLKRTIYLPSDLAKPEYLFTEEGQERDGFFYPTRQLSEKKYRFSFLAPEYLLDVLRFVRMADHVQVTYRGVTYDCDTFLITPEWEGNGDLASVSAEFQTNTVAKKYGAGYFKNH